MFLGPCSFHLGCLVDIEDALDAAERNVSMSQVGLLRPGRLLYAPSPLPPVLPLCLRQLGPHTLLLPLFVWTFGILVNTRMARSWSATSPGQHALQSSAERLVSMMPATVVCTLVQTPPLCSLTKRSIWQAVAWLRSCVLTACLASPTTFNIDCNSLVYGACRRDSLWTRLCAVPLLLLRSSGRYLYRPQASHDPGDVAAARFVGVNRAAVDFHTAPTRRTRKSPLSRHQSQRRRCNC